MNALDKLIEAVEAGNASARILLDLFSDAMPQNNAGCMAMGHQAYHGSLDAALDLHNALLPGWEIRVHTNAGAGWANVWHPEKEGECDSWVCAAQPARAWLLAILRAYRAQQGES